MSVPRRNPKVSQIPSFLPCHFRFSNPRFRKKALLLFDRDLP
jgi:hypothetical protein